MLVALWSAVLPLLLSLASRISSKVTNFGLPACRRGLTDGGGSSGSGGEGCEDEPLVFYLVLLIL